MSDADSNVTQNGGNLDPLFISNSDNPNSALVAAIFNGANFIRWSRGVRRALGAKNKEGFITGSCAEPAITDKDYQKWKRADYMVMSWILSSMTGFRWDRQWMIVNANGRMITQRIEPKLALIQVDLPHEAFVESWEPSSDSHMVLRAPGMDVLKVSLSKPNHMVDHVSVWNWNGSALDEGGNAAEWLSKYLDRTSRLVRFEPASQTRATDPNFANGYKTMFSDQFPFLLISQGSLDMLNKILKEPIPINRFRPNILVEGCEPFSEDLWKEIKIRSLTFYGVRLCSRCKVPSINQETGIAGSEPIETLKGFRSDEILLPNKKPQGQTYVGQHLVCKECFTRDRGKVIQVGDPVHVVQQLSSTAEAAA